jgi:hypothetical protein
MGAAMCTPPAAPWMAWNAVRGEACHGNERVDELPDNGADGDAQRTWKPGCTKHQPYWLVGLDMGTAGCVRPYSG